jgi:hypothetical protein
MNRNREAIHLQQKSIGFAQLCLSLSFPWREVSLLYLLWRFRDFTRFACSNMHEDNNYFEQKI